VQKAYHKTLHSSIRKGMINSDDHFINDQTGINILLGKLQGGKKIEVIYALNLLNKASYPDLDSLLMEQLSGERDPEIKKYVMNELEKKGKIHTETFKNLLQNEPNEEVQQKMMALLCKYDLAFLKNLSGSIPDLNNEIKKIVIVQLLNQQEFSYLFKAGTEINNLIESGDAKERELAVSIISKVKHVQFEGVIEKLMNDQEISVRRRAITAACKLKIKSLLPIVLELSEQPSNKYLVLKALQSYGDSLYQDMQLLEDQDLVKYTQDLIKISGKIKGPHSTRFLLAALEATPGKSNSIVNALWNKEYVPELSVELVKLRTVLNQYLKTGMSKIIDYYEIPDWKEKKLLKESLLTEVRGDLMAALKICVMVFKKKDINRVLELLEMEGNVKVFNAMEMLELMLPQKISKDINHLFDFVLDPSHQKINTVPSVMNTLLQKVFYNKEVSFNSWTKAVCIYCSWINNETDFLKNKRNGSAVSEDFIITETRNYVLNNIK
jgi:hypothetical protein